MSVLDRTRFREALIERMDLTGVGATDLSRRTGVPKTQIDKLRQRKSETTNVNDAILLARAFGQTVEEFMGLRGRAEKTSEINALMATLPPDVRDTLMAQIRAVAALRGRAGTKTD